MYSSHSRRLLPACYHHHPHTTLGSSVSSLSTLLHSLSTGVQQRSSLFGLNATRSFGSTSKKNSSEDHDDASSSLSLESELFESRRPKKPRKLIDVAQLMLEDEKRIRQQQAANQKHKTPGVRVDGSGRRVKNKKEKSKTPLHAQRKEEEKYMRQLQEEEEEQQQQQGELDTQQLNYQTGEWNTQEMGLSFKEYLNSQQSLNEEQLSALKKHMEEELGYDVTQQLLAEAESSSSSSSSAVQEGEATTSSQQPAVLAHDPTAPFGMKSVLAFLQSFDIVPLQPPKLKKKRSVKKITSTETVDVDENESQEAEEEIEPYNPLDSDLLIYDVADRFTFSDFLVVVKVSSARQMRYLAESAYKMARAEGACVERRRILTIEGRGRDDWMLVDCGHIWMYFFNKQPTTAINLNAIVQNNPWMTKEKQPVEDEYGSLDDDQTASNKPIRPLPTLQLFTTNNPTTPISPLATPLPLSSNAITPPALAPSSLLPTQILTPLGGQPRTSPWLETTPDKKKNKRVTGNSSQALTAIVAPQTIANRQGYNLQELSLLNPLHNSNFIHPVLENLEIYYSDKRLTPEEITSLKDYQHPPFQLAKKLKEAEAAATATTTSKGRKRVSKKKTKEVEEVNKTSVELAHEAPNTKSFVPPQLSTLKHVTGLAKK